MCASPNKSRSQTDPPAGDASPARRELAATVCLVGGKRILRSAMRELLQNQGVTVTLDVSDNDALAEWLARQGPDAVDLVVLIVPGGAFRSFHDISETLEKTRKDLPLLVLSDRVSRGEVYAALRIGARAYVNLDAEPEELFRAIEAAAAGKVYLSPDAAKLLVDYVATAAEPSGAPRLPSMELSRREMEIVQLLCEGLSSKQVGRRLHIAPKTVENHRYNIYRKCEVDSIAGLIRYAIQNGLVSI